jgi:hypothetical protein
MTFLSCEREKAVESKCVMDRENVQAIQHDVRAIYDYDDEDVLLSVSVV